MNAGFLDCFRALASVAASEHIEADVKTKANKVMLEYMDVISKAKEIEEKQLQKYMESLSTITL